MTKHRASWAQYLRELSSAEDVSYREIAETVKVHPSSAYRWLKGTVPSPEHVILVARAYGRDPVEALIAAGFLTRADLERPRTGWLDVASSTTAELLRELRKRADPAPTC